ncbi:MAG TPA: septum site-determining protein MinC [Thermodesulfovibrionia bacterium]|nr:septum site-determining protein MinC [Thermodesulfovibrionia bacterium]
MNSSRIITFEGTKDQCILHTDCSIDFTGLMDEIAAILSKHQNFFKDASLVLNLGDREMTESECAEIVSLIKESFNIKIEGAYTTHEQTRKCFDELEIRLLEEVPGSKLKRAEPKLRENHTRIGKGSFSDHIKSSMLNAKLLYGTVRAGQVVDSKGSLVIVGDVNPGGELSAKGDIIVLGSLRGMAHAGMPDNDDAKIIALHLSPTLIKIGTYVASAPHHGEHKKVLNPEIALVEDNQIVTEELM